MKTDERAVVRRRAMILGALVITVFAAYFALVVTTKAVIDFGAETFASATLNGAATPLSVYLDVIAVDPVRHSIEMRLDVATGSGSFGTHYFGRLDRDVELHVSDGEAEQGFRLRRDEPVSSVVFVATLQGAISSYPFDRYATSIVISATELSAKDDRKATPVRVTVWEGVPAWLVSVSRGAAFDNVVQRRAFDAARGLSLAFSVRRPAAHVIFSCVIYGLMVTIAICSVVIGFLTFIGIRRIESTFVGALAAMVFTLPFLRNVLPAAPPLGGAADVYILLAAEVAVTIGLTLYVIAWAQRGSA
jgi:hypothetical protein